MLTAEEKAYITRAYNRLPAALVDKCAPEKIFGEYHLVGKAGRMDQGTNVNGEFYSSLELKSDFLADATDLMVDLGNRTFTAATAVLGVLGGLTIDLKDYGKRAKRLFDAYAGEDTKAVVAKWDAKDTAKQHRRRHTNRDHMVFIAVFVNKADFNDHFIICDENHNKFFDHLQKECKSKKHENSFVFGFRAEAGKREVEDFDLNAFVSRVKANRRQPQKGKYNISNSDPAVKNQVTGVACVPAEAVKSDDKLKGIVAFAKNHTYKYYVAIIDDATGETLQVTGSGSLSDILTRAEGAMSAYASMGKNVAPVYAMSTNGDISAITYEQAKWMLDNNQAK